MSVSLINSKKTINANVLTPNGFILGQMQWDDEGRISTIEGQSISSEQARNNGQAIVLPGFIDLHVHGGAGRDIMEGGDALEKVAQIHASHGTTSILATTMTAPKEDLTEAFKAIGQVMQTSHKAKMAHVLGVHLEGPYISESKLGAQPAFARPVSLSEINQLNALATIRLITLAPEADNNLSLISQLCEQGIKVQLGHTSGSYEQGVQALEAGATGFTHLFNAMSGLHHREPGMVGAALAHAQYAEIIPDLLHVHEGAIKVAMRAIPSCYCVTDSTAAAGMPDGEYSLGRHKVYKCMGGVRLKDGTLAGSTLCMDQAFKNLVNVLGFNLEQASLRVSTFAANHLGVKDRGRLQKNAFADLVILNQDLELQETLLQGRAFFAT
jgi:N-acetylglucosamine-6-phosphate deacetylase